MTKIGLLALFLSCTKFSVLMAQTANNALRLDGVNDFVNLNVLAGPLAATPNFTIEFWVKVDMNSATNSTQKRVNLVAINPAAPLENKFAIIMGDSGTVQVGTLSVYEASASKRYQTTSFMVGNNKCHHIAYVRTGTRGEIFADGISQGTLTVGTLLDSTDRVSIGQDWDNLLPSDFINADFDEMRFWNVARSQAEIQQFMNNKLLGTETGLLAYYQFNQGIGGADNTQITILKDNSESGFDGNLVNIALTGDSSNWVKASFSPEIDLGEDTTVCFGQTFQLSGGIADGYNWTNGVTTPTLAVTNTGTYWLEANNGACTDRDTVNINFIQLPTYQAEQDTFCTGTSLQVNGYDERYSSYIWNDQSSYPTITIEKEGVYTLTRGGVCGTNTLSVLAIEKDCSCYAYAPNSFTPNSDEINPTFGIVYDCEIEQFHMQIYNRWGEMIFESKDPQQTWDGTYSGKLVQDGLYGYKFAYTSKEDHKQRQFTGHVMLCK